MHQAGSDSLITAKVFFKLKEMCRRQFKGRKNECELETRFRGAIYGLGDSVNEDPYIEEYKSLTAEFAQHAGKLIDLTSLQSPNLTKGKLTDILSSTSTSVSSTSSSVNSLTGGPFFYPYTQEEELYGTN